jgi:cell wall-associated NlpC family hydrolase
MAAPRLAMSSKRGRALLSSAAALLLAACQSAPPPRPASSPSVDSTPAPAAREAVADDAWDGSGGASQLKRRGDALADFALSLLGTRYRYGGATPAGFDCSGLVFYAHRKLGLAVPRTSRDQAGKAEPVKPRKLRRGDLVFFKIGGRHVNHVGIYIGERNFVHAPGAGKPVTVNSLDEEFYADAFSSAGRFWDQPPH